MRSKVKTKGGSKIVAAPAPAPLTLRMFWVQQFAGQGGWRGNLFLAKDAATAEADAAREFVAEEPDEPERDTVSWRRPKAFDVTERFERLALEFAAARAVTS